LRKKTIHLVVESVK